MVSPPLERFLQDRYEVVELLGRGRTSEVYRVRDRSTGGDLALKVLEERLTWDPGARARLRREAMVSRRCQHPGIVRVHDIICWGDRAGVLQELVEGVPLQTLLQREAPFDVCRTIDLAAQILDALAAAHERGVVHRDVKPSNVLVESGGRARLVDFGLARVALMTTVTHTGAVLGTPGYLAPEVLRGERVDLRVDLYGVGLLLFEMLCGRVPFPDANGELGPGWLDRRAPRLRAVRPDVPAAVEDLVAELLDRNPDARPSGALEVVERLASLSDADPRGVPCTACDYPMRSTIPLCPRCGLARRLTLRRGWSFVRLRGIEEPQRYEARLRALFGRAVRPRLLRSHASGRRPSVILIRLIDGRSARALAEDGGRFGAATETGSAPRDHQLTEHVPLGVLLAALTASLAAAYILGARATVQEVTSLAWGASVLASFAVAMAAIVVAASRAVLGRRKAMSERDGPSGPDIEEPIELRMKALQGGPMEMPVALVMDAYWEAWSAARGASGAAGAADRLKSALTGALDLAERASELHGLVGGARLREASRTLGAVHARRRSEGASAALGSVEEALEAEIAAIEDADRLLTSMVGRMVMTAGELRRAARKLRCTGASMATSDVNVTGPDDELGELARLLSCLDRDGGGRRRPSAAGVPRGAIG